MVKKKKVAIVGTNGIPAKYGGFETLAENLVLQLQDDINFTVYCSKKQKNTEKFYKKAKLINIPFNANGWQSIIYDTITLLHAFFTSNVILYLGPAAGIVLPLNIFFKKKIITNHGGLNEWEREKLSWFKKKLIWFNHKIAAKYSNINIADNLELKKSIKKSFNKESIVIRYGGDHVKNIPISNKMLEKYNFLKDDYIVSVSRAEIDNNLHLLLETFLNIKNEVLVLVSNWDISQYGKELKEKYKNISNIILLDAIYDPTEINIIRSNAKLYIHSHAMCGTAPSLVEAMCLGLPIICYNVPTNIETTQNKSIYFNNSSELSDIIQKITNDYLIKLSSKMFNISSKEYKWKSISNQYKKIII